MAYNLAGIAVVGKSREETLGSVDKFLKQNTSHLEEIKPAEIDTDSSYNFKAGQLEKLTLLSFPSMGLIPKLILHLSADLKTKVLAVDEYEAVGYKHFSVSQNGVAETVFTEYDGTVQEAIGADYRKLIGRAVSQGNLTLRPGDTEDSPSLAFDAFNYANDEGINIEKMVLEVLEDGNAPTFKMANCKLPTMGSRGPDDFWQKLASATSASTK